MPRDPDKPVLLTRWIQGEARLHFRGGHIATVPLSLRDAHSLRRQVEDKQGAESTGGLNAHSGWVWIRNNEVLMVEWIPAVDYGWPSNTLEDRARLEALGMRHGVIQALSELWGTKRRHKAAADRAVTTSTASYSVNAVAALHSIATSDLEVTRELWDRMAKKLEGVEGARLARPDLTVQGQSRSRPGREGDLSSGHVHDDVEPDSVPSDGTDGVDARREPGNSQDDNDRTPPA